MVAEQLRVLARRSTTVDQRDQVGAERNADQRAVDRARAARRGVGVRAGRAGGRAVFFGVRSRPWTNQMPSNWLLPTLRRRCGIFEAKPIDSPSWRMKGSEPAVMWSVRL